MKGNIALPLDAVAVVIEKARALDAQVDVDDPDSGSNPTDGKKIAIRSGAINGLDTNRRRRRWKYRFTSC